MTIDNEQDDLENPEWSEADIRKGTRLEDVAPELAANIRRELYPEDGPAVRLRPQHIARKTKRRRN